MSDVSDNSFNRYIYRGEADEEVPEDTTHVIVHEDVTVIREHAFYEHLNIIEVICHDKVEKIEYWAFNLCPSLQRVIMPGVIIIGDGVFHECEALTEVECGKLETIGPSAFNCCKSLRSIHLPSAKIVMRNAFYWCEALTDVKFGNKLNRIEELVFCKCRSLERITIPIKNGLIAFDDVFVGCVALKHVDLVEGALHDTIAALHLGEWRDDMDEEIDSINQILPTTSAGSWRTDIGGKAQVIRGWIASVLNNIIHYRAEHQRILNEAATTLELILPTDLVMTKVLPFLKLPSHTF